jgi:ADP-ribose pyrophosphatase YjhB (NUDIX family)
MQLRFAPRRREVRGMSPLHEHLRLLLAAYAASDEDEHAALATTRAFVDHSVDPSSRNTLEGHVTASAVVLDEAGRALLLFHGQLKMWVQPGGHLEAGETPAAGALREAIEESGLTDLQLDPELLDVDVHPIPARPRKNEPAHWHHDLCFVARTRQSKQMKIDPTESKDARWISAGELPTLPLDVATRRRLSKAFARL